MIYLNSTLLARAASTTRLFPQSSSRSGGKGGQEVIFIDGLDQLEEEQSGVRDLSFLPNNPPQGIVFVLGTRPNDTLKPLELLKPRYEYKLPNLSRKDFTTCNIDKCNWTKD